MTPVSAADASGVASPSCAVYNPLLVIDLLALTVK